MLEKNLQLGDTGNEVRILQEKLKILGFYNALITGNFGLSTEEGVKAFQKEHGLAVTGIVDNEMWQMIFEMTEIAYFATSNYPTLGFGSSGSYVRELQVMLTALLYYNGVINSYYDLETQNAVKRFQFHNDLTTAGIVNNQTWTVLDILYGNLNECVSGNIGANYINYMVVSGDTLYSIAKKYNTTVDAIITLNNLTSNILSIGQILKIPTTSSESITTRYTVVSGDTLYSIAKKYNTTVDAIKRLNNLTSDILSIGQVLQIPTSSGETNYTTYTVVSGDTLYSIAKRYNTTIDAIKNLNNLTSNTLSIGQVLKIPTSSSGNNYITYTVVKGDTLYSIAQRYNTTVDAIKSLNNLATNTISVGQVLKINV